MFARLKFLWHVAHEFLQDESDEHHRAVHVDRSKSVGYEKYMTLQELQVPLKVGSVGMKTSGPGTKCPCT